MIAVFASLGLFFFCRAIALAQAGLNPEDIFNEANSLYRHNQYPAAQAEYERILRSGWESGNLYYNLGNCYFKQGKYGLALLNYERAKRFIPGDSDLRANYDYARSLLNLNGDYLPGNRLTRAIDRAFSGLNPSGLAIILSLLYLMILSCLAIRIFLGRQLRFYKTILAALICAFILVGSALFRQAEYFAQGAIVVAKEMEAKFEPLASSTTYFTLPEGSKLIVVDTSSDWFKVKRPDNKVGWVEASGLEQISLP
jgi:tetratricopeptide (TPR) repeat protein